MSVNVSKELPKFPFVVATNHPAESLLFLSLEDQDGHLAFGQLGTGWVSGHGNDPSVGTGAVPGMVRCPVSPAELPETCLFATSIYRG